MAHFVDFGETAGIFRPSLKTIFNGFNLDDELTDDTGSFMTLSVSGRNDSEYDITTHDVPGLDGVIEEGNPTLNPRIISVRFRIKADTSTQLQRKFEKLRSLLEGSKKELSFTDDEFFFYATNQTLEIPDETSNSLTSVITFLCSDPYKYGPEKTVIFPSDLVMVNNEGTAEAFPVYEMTVTAPITFAMIQNHLDEVLMIGHLGEVDTPAFVERELILHDSMDSLTGWGYADDIDFGTVTGNFTVNGSEFVVDSWGNEEGENKWYGPAIKHDLGEELQDFRVDCRVQNIDDGDQVGRVELYLLDVNDEIIGRITLKDAWQGYRQNRGEARVGNEANGHYLLTDDYAGAWRDFRGMLRLERRGNQWTSYIAQIAPDGTHHARETRRYIDVGNSYLDRVAKIQIAIAKFGDYEATNASIYDIKVWRINRPSDDEIPHIAYPGDIITFDTQSEEMLINGEDAMIHKDFITEFFSLKKGENTLGVLPENSLDVQMRYKERRK